MFLKGFPESDKLRSVEVQVSPQKSSRSCIALYLRHYGLRLPPSGKRMELRKHGPHPRDDTWQIDKMSCTPSFLSGGAFIEHASNIDSASNFSKSIIRWV